MRFSFLTLGLVKGLCPEGKAHGLIGPFDERLSQELGTTVSPVYPELADSVVFFDDYKVMPAP